MNIELNPNLDLQGLRQDYQSVGKLRIPNFLTEKSAEYVLDNLLHTTPWHLVHSDENGLPVRYDPQALQTLSDDKLRDLTQKLHKRAEHSYQYTYKFFPIIDAIKAGSLAQDSMLFQMATFVNSTQFLSFARTLTGTNSLVKVDPQVTLYESGHFLSTHDDSNYQRSANDNSTRRHAIVLGFTKDWSQDWGGHTSFFTKANASQSESWMPCFNTLTIFKVPVLHCVNYVAPYAAHGRYSVTGWLRDDPSIKRTDLGD